MAIRRGMILVQSTLLSLLFLSVPHFTSHVEAGLSKEVERRFNVSESAAVGERLGNVLDSKPAEWDPKNENFLVVYPDATPRGGEKAAGQPLDLNPMTGEITIRSALDHENQSRLTALVVPIDPSLSPIRLIVEVLDENDNAPTFPNERITIQLSEYARMGTEVALPAASDPDSPPLSVERYRLLSAGNVNNAFRLASQRFNGQLLLDLLVNGKLDREYRERYHLVIEALDGGMPPRTGRLNVEVEILDANDNIPEFLQTHYEAHIPDGESVPVGYPVVKLKAKDADKGENARITYRFTKALTSPNTTRSQGSVPLPFEVDPDSGTVIVSRSPLPRDVVLWEVWVAASDHGKPHALESIVLLSITVGGDQSGMDIADQASHQHQKWYLNVAWLTDDASERAEENLPVGYVLARIAIDGTMKESVQAHRLSLHGSGESILCLKETDSPLVYLMIVCGYLDRETQGDFLSVNLVLRNRHDEVLLDHPLHLTLLDVNDNAPRWNQSVFHLQWRWHRLKIMDEHQYRLLATDADEGENGRIHYSIVNPSSTSGNKSTTLAPPFKIDRELGILSMMPLVDYSTHLAESSKACSPPSPSSYRFQVLAEDNGRPERLHSIADVWLELVDADAPPPQFEKSLYEVRVSEDVDVGTCLVQVSATPSTCISLPENSSLRYSLHSAHQSFSPFRIDPISGKICLSHALDYERQRSYQLSAHVQDGNNIGKWSSALVSVAVEDVNDEIPRFQPTRYEVNLGVYAGGGSTPQRELLRVLAVDADASEAFSAIRYSLVNNDSVAFRIDPITGQIFQNGPVGVQNASVELRVEAKDTGGLASHDSAIVTIHPYRVENAEKCPKFSSPLYEFEVQEDLLPGIQVGPQLELVNGHQLDFNMSIEGADDRFLLDERHFGRLLLARELDADGPDGNSILLNLRLHSSSHEANGHRSTKSCPPNDYAQVLIHLADINDNTPRFSLPRMDVQVAENYPIHQALYVVKAEDADRGEENSLVGYELLESEPVGCPVQIHPTTGELSLAAPLDYEHKTHYTLTVRARDHGLPPRHSTARLELNVIDVNDNAPQFPQSHYQLTVSEDASMMAKLASVKAEDADSAENGFVNYRLEGDEAIKELFTIDPLKGELLLRGQLDREKRHSYSFVAVANDFGSPRLSSNATIHVQVTDVNDNTPQCAGNGTQMAFNLSGTAMGEHGKIPRSDLFGLVGIVKALDLDEGENGSLIYRLQTPSTLFELKPKGELVLKKRLSSAPSSSKNHPTTVIYRLSVVVEDQGRPYRRSTVCQVTVRVSLHPADGSKPDKSGHQLTSLDPLRSSKRRPPGLERPIVVELRPGLEVWKAGQVLFDGFRPSKGHYYKLVDENWATATSPFGLDEVTGAVYLADPIKLLARQAENAGKEDSFNHSLLIERHSMVDSNATEAVNTTTVQFIAQAEAVDGVGGGLWPPLTGGFAPMLRDYHVSEEMGIGTVIGRVTLKAKDGIESFNEISPTTEPDSANPISRVRFRLLETFSSTNQFTVDERTAELSIQRVLQSHLIPVHHLVVQAYIAAENSSNNNPIEKTEGYRTANCVVRVYVHGVNDHSPEWLSTANRTLPLDWLQRLPALNAEPVIIHHFVANDADMGDYVDEGEKVEWRRLTYEMASKAKAKEAGLELDAKTGALSVVDKRALEKMGGLELELVVKAWDWGSWPNATGRRYTEQHFFLHIIAGTTNDIQPSQSDHHQQQLASSHSTYFPESHYRFTISAGSSEGAVINNFKRMDWSTSIAGEEDTISFKLFQHHNGLNKPEKGTSKEAASVFEIGAKDGILKVREGLAETRYRTIVYAEGGARNRTLWSEHTLVEVAVKSEIPGPKIAQSSCGTISVRENEAIPYLLRVFALQPANESTSRKLHWKLEGLSTGEPLFFIGSTSGQLSCRELDREQKSEHLLVISASYTLIDDTTQPVVKMDVCTVHVRVLDTNDNVPQFISTESSDEVMVANSTRVGDIVGRVRAEDLDEGENGLVRYRMLMPSKAEALESVLEVDAESGLIVFKREPSSLPISPPAEFTATMIAEDGGHSRILHAEKAIRVTWKRLPSSSFKNHTSSSQRSPLRRRHKLTAIVLENAEKGQLVAQLELPASKALTSKTNNATSAVNFRIVEGNSGQVFEVDQMGRVLVGSPNASNADNNSHGGALDAETRSVYRLVVVARREQSALAEWELTVRVLGTNNGWPKFVEIETEMSLPESTPVGTLLWQLKATDPDSDTDLRYTLIGDVTAEKIFHVGYVTGAIHLQQALDFESPPTIHVFGVQVTDGVHSTAMNLTLRVQDVNDNEPSFTGFSVADETAGLGAIVVGSELDQGVGWLELEMGAEALSYGGTIGKFQAMDADSGENGRIEFGVRDPYSLFGIDPDKGTLRSLHRLRRNQIYFFDVFATDHGHPPLSSTVTVKLTTPSTEHASGYSARDSALRSPGFAQPEQRLSVSESHAPFLSFTRLETKGGRSGANGRECHFFTTTSKFFGVSPLTAELYPLMPLDREIYPNGFTIDVEMRECRSNRTVSKSRTHLKLIDVNEHWPEFHLPARITDPNMSISIGEATPRDTPLAPKFAALDVDDTTDGNGRVTYRILAGDDYAMLKLHPTEGWLVFDHWDERVVWDVQKRTLECGDSVSPSISLLTVYSLPLIIAAADNGVPKLVSTLQLTNIAISLSEWRGSAPRFPVIHKSPTRRQSYSTRLLRHFVREDTPPGTILFTGSAVNYAVDVESRAGWRYSLREIGPLKHFTVNETTAEISLIHPLDYENITSHELHLTVEDPTRPSRNSDNTTVVVEVVGVDEHAPVFTKSSYTFQLPYKTPIGYILGRVEAYDEDVGVGSKVEYGMAPSADPGHNGLIAINKETGHLSLRALVHPSFLPLNNQSMVLRQLMVAASSSPAHSNQALVYLEFLGADAATPAISSTPWVHGLFGNLLSLPMLLLSVLLVSTIAMLVYLYKNVRQGKDKAKGGEKEMLRLSPTGNKFDLNRLSPSPTFADKLKMGINASSAAGQFSSQHTDIFSLSVNSNASRLSSQQHQIPLPQSEPILPPRQVQFGDRGESRFVDEYLASLGVTGSPPFKEYSLEELQAELDEEGDRRGVVFARLEDILGPGPVVLAPSALSSVNNSCAETAFNHRCALNTSLVSFTSPPLNPRQPPELGLPTIAEQLNLHHQTLRQRSEDERRRGVARQSRVDELNESVNGDSTCGREEYFL